MRPAALLSFAVLALAACSGQPAQPWERPDHTPPTARENSYCREEASRQAGALYPDRPPSDAAGVPRESDIRRFPAEIRLYEQCMTRSGFVRAATR
jgi:hypothetical protein